MIRNILAITDPTSNISYTIFLLIKAFPVRIWDNQNKQGDMNYWFLFLFAVWRLHPNTRNQAKGMLEVLRLAMSIQSLNRESVCDLPIVSLRRRTHQNFPKNIPNFLLRVGFRERPKEREKEKEDKEEKILSFEFF